MEGKKERGGGALPEHINDMRTRVTLGADYPKNTTTYNDADAFAPLHYDNAFRADEFRRAFRINVAESDDEHIVFDMIGIDAALANAFRRILLAEVPTMAIEKVLITNNTSIIQDEVFAHRLGLIPIKVDPRLFKFKKSKDAIKEDTGLVFRLQVKCERRPDAAPDAKLPADKYVHESVYSGELQWEPIGDQAARFAANPPAPVHGDILLSRLRPGQSLDIEMHCEKGIGKEHAKWSPVSTASYRLMPEITFTREVTGDMAQRFKDACPFGVFDIEDLAGGVKRARVARPRDCGMCRECIRDVEMEKCVKLARVKDHFIFSVETTGILPPIDLVHEAVKVLAAKCANALRLLDASESGAAGGAGAAGAEDGAAADDDEAMDDEDGEEAAEGAEQQREMEAMEAQRQQQQQEGELVQEVAGGGADDDDGVVGGDDDDGGGGDDD